jgi:hypothetical protein
LGLARLPKSEALTWTLAGTLAVALSIQARLLTFGQMGQWLGESRASWSAWGRADDVNRLMWEASEHTDLCGIILANVMWNGGYTYLHRDVPSLWGLGQQDVRAANYVIAPGTTRLPPIYEKVGEQGQFSLFRREGSCEAPFMGYSRNMPGP